MNTSRQTVLILRGGARSHAQSIELGAELIESFPRFGCDVVDVYIDKEGVWYKSGIPVEPHAVLAHVDAYIDLASGRGDEAYHALAKRMGVMRLASGDTGGIPFDRESVFHLLRQAGILVPETKVFRKEQYPNEETLHTLWRTMLTPIMIRDIHGGTRATLAHTVQELAKALVQYLATTDVHVLTYRNKKPRSVVVLPSYRGQEYYVPVPVETQIKKYELPHGDHRIMSLGYLREEEKSKLADFGRSVYQKLPVNDMLLIDCIETPRGYMVVDVNPRPNLHKVSRARESMMTTGVDLAHYFSSRIAQGQQD